MKEVKRIARDAAGGTRLAEDSGPEVLDSRAGRAAPLEDEVAAVAGEAFLDLGECRRPSRLQPRRSNWRCTRRAVPAGRRADRTGVVCTAALDVAGVTREAIVADYAQTGERLEAILRRLRASDTYAADLDSRPPDSHLPHAATMEKLLTRVDERYGGTLGWLSGHGWTDDDTDALRTRLLT